MGSRMGMLIVFIVRIAYIGLLCTPSGLEIFFGFFPVDGQDEVLVVLRGVDLQQRMGLLRIVATEEEPTVGHALSGTGQVEVQSRGFQLERDIEFAGFFVYADKADMPLEVLLVGTDGYIAPRSIR